jgi:cell division protein FtsL
MERKGFSKNKFMKNTEKYFIFIIVTTIILINTPLMCKGKEVHDKDIKIIEIDEHYDKEQLQWKMAWCWRAKDKTEDEIVRMAKSMGFNAIEAHSKKMIELCHKAGMEAIGVTWFGAAPAEFAQLMLPHEQEQLKFQDRDSNSRQLYQSGGEPLLKAEVCHYKQWCIDLPETLTYGEQVIDGMISDGYDGIALDGIGYQNYYACFCPKSREKHKEFVKQHPELSPEAAINKYSEEQLISFCNKLISYAREKKPGIKITIHVFPNFAPHPLYGNKIAVDYCGQTVSWFFVPHWSLEKVKNYTEEMVRDQSAYNNCSIAAPFLGIYTFEENGRHKKSPERIRNEIRIIKNSGAKAIQIAELGNIFSDPNIAKVISEELDGTWK